MKQLITWINQKDELPVPIKAGIVHCQYATIHPYYEALTVGPPHNYYMGRAEADITKWIAYFIEGMATSFEKVRDQALREAEKLS